jgi:hypothetical protein
MFCFFLLINNVTQKIVWRVTCTIFYVEIGTISTCGCKTHPKLVVNFKSDEKSDRSIDIFQPIRMLHFEEFSTKLTHPTYEKSDGKSKNLMDL